MKYIFDVDGVLCNTGCKIDPGFKKWFLEWSKDKEYYLVTGGERKSTIEQVGIEIVENAKIGFHCMGNQIFIEGREYKINQFKLPDDVRALLLSFLDQSPYPLRTSNHIEERPGSINFSIIGRNASYDQKVMYNKWDKTSNERRKIIADLKREFPWLDAYIGGNASIDICLRGANKKQTVRLTGPGENLFFGDRCGPDEIDHPITTVCQFKVVRRGYAQTKVFLETL